MDMWQERHIMTRRPITARTLRKAQRNRGILYRLLRNRLGITQKAMAALVGCSVDAITAREAKKRLYSAEEMIALYEISGMTAEEWIQLLREVAK